jgi:hypothetical protein
LAPSLKTVDKAGFFNAAANVFSGSCYQQTNSLHEATTLRKQAGIKIKTQGCMLIPSLALKVVFARSVELPLTPSL